MYFPSKKGENRLKLGYFTQNKFYCLKQKTYQRKAETETK